ncbi:hypothetical protein [Solirhodobacter olei]|uniref:hypothetical protein n=1 Tax=Solirhodobacter olei TaxID=2493082 RepID=UPI000FD8C5BA|nr:hypothetical protein [Solirhodobacter olei]
MPNTFAYVALFSWPFVVLLLFRTMPRAKAIIWSIVGGYLLLPYGVEVKVPMVPAFDKVLIPSFSAAVMCLFTFDRLGIANDSARLKVQPQEAANGNRPALGHRLAVERRDPFARGPSPHEATRAQARKRRVARAGRVAPQHRKSKGTLVLNILIALVLLVPFATVLTNPEPVVIGRTQLPGLRLYDAFSMTSRLLVELLPFFLGRRYLGRPDNQALLLRTVCLSGILYSLPVLFEVRMSPQLSRWIYGFLAQSFIQTMRDGGYRPVVFLQHGLWLAIFVAMTALAGFLAYRLERDPGRRKRWLLAGIYLAVVLVLCHSLGALIILIALAPAALFLSIPKQLILASVVAISYVTYPMLRGADLVPVDTVFNFVEPSISKARVGSFYFRLKNEDRLLARAMQKPIVGWGGWGRSRVYDSNGKDISTTDGIWVIVIGKAGWAGYIAEFGLLTGSILLLTLRRRKLAPSLATSGLCLVLAANLIDMVPNATLTPVTWLIAGALAGRYSFGEDPEGARATERPRGRGLGRA